MYARAHTGGAEWRLPMGKNIGKNLPGLGIDANVTLGLGNPQQLHF